MNNEFVFVDTAVFGAQNRNKVMPIEDFTPPVEAWDCFTTYLRFPEDLLQYSLENLHPRTGKPSVSGYPGPAMAEFVPFDFDCAADPAKAVAEAAHFIRWWEQRWGLDPETLRIYWSGMKGISIEVPADLFGGFDPSPDIARDLKVLATAMAPNAQTLDTSIYEKLRLWRVPNTRHGRSGLFKIPLTVEELFDATH